MQAQDLFKSLKQDYGQKLPVLLLEIELMTQDASPCADTYATGEYFSLGYQRSADLVSSTCQHHSYGLH